MSRISVVGAGYVGLTSAACLADLGNDVCVVDIDPEKVRQLRRHRLHFYEPGLAEVVERNARAGRLQFTTSYQEAIPGSEFAFIAVATPEGEGGEANLAYVQQAAASIAENLDGPIIVVNKSTVPIGTGDVVSDVIKANNTHYPVEVVSNPEFLREGSALRDFMEPDRVVIGAHQREAAEQVAKLYEPLGAPILLYNLYTAEMVKYASNAFLAARISFINEISRICERVDADAKLVAEGMGLDRRIGSAFLDAGIGYGGSCLTGDETVLVRRGGSSQLISLERLYAELEDDEPCEVLAWDRDAATPQFLPIAAATRRVAAGEILEVRTKMGRRLRCTPDHPFVTRDGVKLAEQLDDADWLPLAQLSPAGTGTEETVDVVRTAAALAVVPGHDVARVDAPHPGELARPRLAPEGALVETARRPRRIPDSIWEAPSEHKLALLAGLWRGDGSWSYQNGGPSVVLEYGTVSRELADGILRLLGDLGFVGSQQVGRTGRSTRDTYWIRVSGADQVERLLDLVSEADREQIRGSIARQKKRIAPTGYRRGPSHAAWVRVTGVERRPFQGPVYSLEVPGAHTFVTTGGVVVHNCFPKDVKALAAIAEKYEYHPELLNAVMDINRDQRRLAVEKLRECLGTLRDQTIGLLGLSFKPNTDDMREAPSLEIARELMKKGATVRAYDPAAIDKAKAILPEVEYRRNAYAVARGADAVVVVTEWNEFRQIDLGRLKRVMRRPVLVDGRNIYDPADMRRLGFVYRGIGRN